MYQGRLWINTLFTALTAWLVLSSCNTAAGTDIAAYPTYDPFVQTDAAGLGEVADPDGPVVRERGPTPTFAPLSVTLPPRETGAPMVTATPDEPRILPTPRQGPDEYVVRPGDTLGAIAQSFGVGIGALLDANGLSDEDVLALGLVLKIPSPVPGEPGNSFKIIPDSELVNGPAAADFDVEEFVAGQGGYLSEYVEPMDTQTVSGADIVSRVAKDSSVNPRLLLALLELQSGWVTLPQPASAGSDFPLGFIHPNRVGLYRQLAWAANELNRGFYLWRVNAVGTWVLNDGSVVPASPIINAGTAAVQSYFAVLDDRESWDTHVGPFGLFQTYFFMFGSPFDLAIEPLQPGADNSPSMQLPFEPGVFWSFTGGPHAAWDSGSGWAALDFAPPDVLGCAVSQEWVTAVSDGFIVRSSGGAVVQDLDGDGREQTGWNVLYLHVFEQDRLPAGTYAYAGDRLGHPSCEGGISSAAHLHLARKHNGEWIPADGAKPFVLEGWISEGQGTEYDGYLRRGSEALEAREGVGEGNQIAR